MSLTSSANLHITGPHILLALQTTDVSSPVIHCVYLAAAVWHKQKSVVVVVVVVVGFVSVIPVNSFNNMPTNKVIVSVMHVDQYCSGGG